MRIVFYAQFVVVASVVLYMAVSFYMDRSMPEISMYIVLLGMLCVMVVINGYFVMRDKSLFNSLSTKFEAQEMTYENVKELNRTLRGGQRHDFLNHIQVLYTLMELKEYDETKEYLDDLYADVGKLSSNIKTKSIPINALLQAKSIEAENLGIPYTVKVTTPFNRYNMPDWEMCRVMANLIDNAIEASNNDGLKMRSSGIKIIICENIKSYQVIISNWVTYENNPIFEENGQGHTVLTRIFEAGYTTKKEKKDHGMGLYIVKSTLEKHQNTIEATWDKGIVSMTLTIMKNTE